VMNYDMMVSNDHIVIGGLLWTKYHVVSSPVRIQHPLESLETMTISMGYKQYNQLCVYSNYMMWASLGLWLVSNIFDFRTSGWWSTGCGDLAEFKHISEHGNT